MSAEAATLAGRRMAERRMVDTFAIRKSTARYVYDPVAGHDVEVTDLLFTTVGRVKTNASPGTQEVGGRTAAVATRELHIPTASGDVPTGALAVCTSVASSSDPSLLGAILRLDGPAPGSQVTARRLRVSEVLT